MAAGCLAGAGCTAEPEAGARRRTPTATAGRTPAQDTSTPTPSEEAVSDPDVELAVRAVRELRSALHAVRMVDRRHKQLATELEPVAAAHAAQLALLVKAVTEGAGAMDHETAAARSAERARGPGRALHHVVRLERELDTSLRRHAFAAESGAFARLLASMSASAAQHATVLSRSAGRRGHR